MYTILKYHKCFLLFEVDVEIRVLDVVDTDSLRTALEQARLLV